MQMCMIEVDHVIQHDTWHICAEASVVSLGLSGAQDLDQGWNKS